MQVKELESKGLKKKFSITVPATRINAQTEAELKAAGERVKIPGFRPGFIPMKVLQQRYGKAVQADVLKHVINHSSTEAIKEKKLRPAMTPQVNIEDYKDGGDLTFTMEIEAFPDVPQVTFDRITLDRKTFEIEEKDIDESVARIATFNPKLKPAKEGAKAEMGNVVIIDFKGMIGGVAFDGGSATDFRLELGSKQFIEGFEEQLVGAKVGDERKVKVTFPKDYRAENLAGKAAEFAVTVKAVQEKETPLVDNELAKANGFADLRALREAVRDQMMREYSQLVRNHLKRELFDILEEEYDLDLPQGMLEAEFNTIWERLQQARAEGDPSVAGKSEEELREEYQAIAKRRVKLGILLAEIGNQNKVQVSREELSRAAMQQASQFPGQEQKVMEFYQKNPERIDDLRGPILEEKVVDFILTKVKYNDGKVALAELASDDGETADSGDKKKKSTKTKKKK
jgi:trigger factor